MMAEAQMNSPDCNTKLIGTGQPLASALAKIDSAARRIPMNVDPAHATAYIVNPLTGRQISFAGWLSMVGAG